MLDAQMLSFVYASLMALAILLYAVLDGYDLGVGILLPTDNEHHADSMIASIGPFWDANETWLVLAVGLALIAFPAAHSMILQALYLPITVMLIGLIIRGVAFDFRAKAKIKRKSMWNKLFKIGSIISAFTQGYMLGLYVMSFEQSVLAFIFACLSGIGVVAAYALIGAAWLVLKTQDELQLKAIAWCQLATRMAFFGVMAVSAINPIINHSVYVRWFESEILLLLLPMPIVCLVMFVLLDRVLWKLKHQPSVGSWLPFLISCVIFILCFFGLLYSFYPYVVPGKLTIFEALAAPESLRFLFYGVVVVVPTILAYTAFSYRVFWGKVQPLSYY
ncbi:MULTISPECIES: cytochrome d ubiquinol oxidase subunit II [Pseudoalteromonas]|uniref:Cytochrome BD ubiquinol oxidase subunit II n=1 Tax=Pseudoalteromonas amylolytica TaxID=1859457 RepID=A0A1S1N0U7_9GAMM|nr:MULTISPECIES: cytochrome d ubiquinol oxidase subunit II [Pseudoalteromonas]MCF6434420.1 cytochrome d ubiquinol oxidase subunit II [Pseudoalteromonas sp. MMG022]OHU85459.1 cytochrome BD ubiquinol oxidase subunit II [Pseudoalteromonas sp. JW3]OHU92920.1 cytochrome BD ubiquinol oxidase subunit II [Pseudoalteromonas amylolytica]